MTFDSYQVEQFPFPLKYQRIYCENLRSSGQNSFIVCALFTPDQMQYYQYAQRLAASCERFGLSYSIYEIPFVHRSINMNGTDDSSYTKANFIAYNMSRFSGRNIFYVDADVLFVDNPKLIVEASEKGYDFAIYNWLNDEHNEAYAPIMTKREEKTGFSEFYVYSHHIGYYSSTQLICSGGVQFYRNCSESHHLLQEWQSIITQNPYSADDECLDFAFNNLEHSYRTLQCFWLDKPYLRLPWWPHVKPVILHLGLPTAGGNRISPAETAHKKRFYPEKCQQKNLALHFPPDCIVDTKRSLLLKMKNSEVVNMQRITQDFWIYPEFLE